MALTNPKENNNNSKNEIDEQIKKMKQKEQKEHEIDPEERLCFPQKNKNEEDELSRFPQRRQHPEGDKVIRPLPIPCWCPTTPVPLYCQQYKGHRGEKDKLGDFKMRQTKASSIIRCLLALQFLGCLNTILTNLVVQACFLVLPQSRCL